MFLNTGITYAGSNDLFWHPSAPVVPVPGFEKEMWNGDSDLNGWSNQYIDAAEFKEKQPKNPIEFHIYGPLGKFKNLRKKAAKAYNERHNIHQGMLERSKDELDSGLFASYGKDELLVFEEPSTTVDTSGIGVVSCGKGGSGSSGAGDETKDDKQDDEKPDDSSSAASSSSTSTSSSADQKEGKICTVKIGDNDVEIEIVLFCDNEGDESSASGRRICFTELECAIMHHAFKPAEVEEEIRRIRENGIYRAIPEFRLKKTNEIFRAIVEKVQEQIPDLAIEELKRERLIGIGTFCLGAEQ